MKITRTDATKLALEDAQATAQAELLQLQQDEVDAARTFREAARARVWQKNRTVIKCICEAMGLDHEQVSVDIRLDLYDDVELPTVIDAVVRDAEPHVARLICRLRVPVDDMSELKAWVEAYRARNTAERADRSRKAMTPKAQLAAVSDMLDRIPEGQAVLDAVKAFNKAAKEQGIA